MTDAIDVEPSGSNISCDEDVDITFLQLGNHLFAVFLRHVAIQCCRRIPPGFQSFRKFCCRYFCTNKNQYAIKGFNFQYSCQRIELVKIADRPVTLIDRFRCGCLGLDGDIMSVSQVALRDLLDLLWHGGREECNLSALRRLLQYPFDVVDKTHSQHLIGFIKHQCLQVIEFQCAFPHVIHDTTWRANDDVNAASQGANLSGIFLSAIDRRYMKPLHMMGIALESLGNLNGQLPCWCQDQHLFMALLKVNSCQQWQGKCCGLPGTGWCVTNEVGPLE